MFDYADLYKSVIDRTNDGVFVEVGSLYGKSASYMGVEIINSQKDIHLHCVDSWSFKNLDLRESHPMSDFMQNKITGDDVFTKFKKNIEPIEHVIDFHRMDSIQASEIFSDRSVDFVFIDGEHSYEGCLGDIRAWLPKVKNGGTIAGHDYLDDTQPGVTRAVREVFGDRAQHVSERCWQYIVE